MKRLGAYVSLASLFRRFAPLPSGTGETPPIALTPHPGFAAIALPDGASILMDRCDGRDQVAAQALAEGWTSFEAPLPRIFRDTIRRMGGDVIDVGANTGFYSLLAARAQPAPVVLAFEPDPAVRETLQRNVEANALTRCIHICPLGLSDRSGEAGLYIPDSSHGLVETSSSLEPDFKPAHGAVLQVEVSTLDAFLASSKLIRNRIGVIKIDVEGHEAPVLRGAAATVARHRPVLFVELLPRADFTTMRRFLAEHSYVDIPLRPNFPLAVADDIAFVDDAWNHAFLPAEQDTGVLLG
jgi:FkbM family methyltransferase